MQAIKERAIATYQKTVPIWLHYVDDTFTILHQDEINTFHERLNEQYRTLYRRVQYRRFLF